MNHPSAFDHQAQLDPLYVPVPADLAPLLGYHGVASQVAFYWHQGVDSVAYHDGDNRGVGETLRFLAYLGHEAVEAEITMDIGLCSWPAPNWLLLNRQSDQLYAGSPLVIREILLAQHDMHDALQYRVELTDDPPAAIEDPVAERLRLYLDRWYLS